MPTSSVKVSLVDPPLQKPPSPAAKETLTIRTSRLGGAQTPPLARPIRSSAPPLSSSAPPAANTGALERLGTFGAGAGVRTPPLRSPASASEVSRNSGGSRASPTRVSRSPTLRTAQTASTKASPPPHTVHEKTSRPLRKISAAVSPKEVKTPKRSSIAISPNAVAPRRVRTGSNTRFPSKDAEQLYINSLMDLADPGQVKDDDDDLTPGTAKPKPKTPAKTENNQVLLSQPAHEDPYGFDEPGGSPLPTTRYGADNNALTRRNQTPMADSPPRRPVHSPPRRDSPPTRDLPSPPQRTFDRRRDMTQTPFAVSPSHIDDNLDRSRRIERSNSRDRRRDEREDERGEKSEQRHRRREEEEIDFNRRDERETDFDRRRDERHRDVFLHEPRERFYEDDALGAKSPSERAMQRSRERREHEAHERMFSPDPNRNKNYDAFAQEEGFNNNLTSVPAIDDESIEDKAKRLLLLLDQKRAEGAEVPERFRSENTMDVYEWSHMQVEDMKTVLHRIEKEEHYAAGKKWGRSFVQMAVNTLEYANRRFDPLGIKWNGWSRQVRNSIDQFDRPIMRTWNMYVEPGGDMHPLMELVSAIALSGYTYHQGQEHAEVHTSQRFDEAVKEKVQTEVNKALKEARLQWERDIQAEKLKESELKREQERLEYQKLLAKMNNPSAASPATFALDTDLDLPEIDMGFSMAPPMPAVTRERKPEPEKTSEKTPKKPSSTAIAEKKEEKKKATISLASPPAAPKKNTDADALDSLYYPTEAEESTPAPSPPQSSSRSTKTDPRKQPGTMSFFVE